VVRRPLRFIGVVACCTLVGLTAGVGSANAFGSVGVSVGSASLTAKVLLTVPVAVTCAPLDPIQFYGDSSVIVEQAVGKQIAFGSGSFTGFTCDNTPHTVNVDVLARTDGPPFHGGSAVARASASVCGYLGGEFGCQSGSSGYQKIKIR
jgi:hypothetical protein